MPRRSTSDPNLPPLPSERTRRTEQVKIRLSPDEVASLEKLRPDRSAAGILSLLVEDVLAGNYRPQWALSLDSWSKGDGDGGSG
jgi:hypothetical protein